jgi:hypothetical protein
VDRDGRVNPIGNERLTAAVGLLLLAPVFVEIATVLLGVHTFMSIHVFVGLALIPAVVLKLVSIGWRFTRYYTRSRAYVDQGPPQTAMRLLAPLFVVATIVLFGSGVAMGFLHGHALEIVRRLHGPASVIWLALLGLHVVVYFGRALRSAARDVQAVDRARVRGRTARTYAVAAAVVCGLVLGAALVPAQHRWVDLRHDHHDQREGAISPLRETPRLRTRKPSGRSSRRPAMPSPGRRSGRGASSRRA